VSTILTIGATAVFFFFFGTAFLVSTLLTSSSLAIVTFGFGFHVGRVVDRTVSSSVSFSGIVPCKGFRRVLFLCGRSAGYTSNNVKFEGIKVLLVHSPSGGTPSSLNADRCCFLAELIELAFAESVLVNRWQSYLLLVAHC
jgi:hypothetical protein